MRFRTRLIACAAVCLVTVATMPGSEASGSQAGPDTIPATRDAAAHDHVLAIENSYRASLDDVVADFEHNRLSPEFLAAQTPEARRALLDEIRRAARDAGGVLVNEEDGLVNLSLEGDGIVVVSFRVSDTAPFRITQLQVREGGWGRRDLGMTLNNIDDVMTRLLQEEDFASVVYVAIDGEEAHRRAYGVVDPEGGELAAVDTIFGIGSRPIDFTVAGILLLVQRGDIRLEDPISDYFDAVPDDKKAMTLRHLMTGRSGLPDFHGLTTDWDQDLAWIDRAEAERRILAQPLKFEPGSGEAHSHSAFGLLAAVIERVSGKDYMAFLSEHFFEPAGMARTGEYGALDGHRVSDFAVGRGKSVVGEPNIPPNWGRTSWLVKGSGGMYSTLDDLLKFYSFVRTSGVLEERHLDWFRGSSVNVDGSERGFELFSAYDEDGEDTAFLFMAVETPSDAFRDVAWALESLVAEN